MKIEMMPEQISAIVAEDLQYTFDVAEDLVDSKSLFDEWEIRRAITTLLYFYMTSKNYEKWKSDHGIS